MAGRKSASFKNGKGKNRRPYNREQAEKKFLRKELIEAALEVCDAIEDVTEGFESDLGLGLVAAMAARLITEGDREALLRASRQSVEIVTDEDVVRIVAELDEGDDDYDDED